MPTALLPLLLTLLAPPHPGYPAGAALQIVDPDERYVVDAVVELGGVRLPFDARQSMYRIEKHTPLPQRLVIKRKGHTPIVFRRFHGPRTIRLLRKGQPYYLSANMPIRLTKMPMRFAVGAASNDPKAPAIQASLRAVLGRDVPVERVSACRGAKGYEPGLPPAYWTFDLPSPTEQAKLCANLLKSNLHFGVLVEDASGPWILTQRVTLRLMPGTTRAQVDALLTRHFLTLTHAWPRTGDPVEIEVASRRACGLAPAVALAEALSDEPAVSHVRNGQFIFACHT